MLRATHKPPDSRTPTPEVPGQIKVSVEPGMAQSYELRQRIEADRPYLDELEAECLDLGELHIGAEVLAARPTLRLAGEPGAGRCPACGMTYDSTVAAFAVEQRIALVRSLEL